MKIKIIDLLNNIANKEEVPKKIKIEEIEYKIVNPVYPHMYKDYNGNELEDNIHYITRFLDKEVEIIEEPKEIEKLDYFNLCKDNEDGDLELTYTGVADTFDDVYEKINELIDVVNELKKEEK